MSDSVNSVHHAAAEGYTPNTADHYVSGRPGYPAEVAGWLHDQLDLHEGSVVVDLGAGTGKFTPYLVATGASVIAVEPVAAMLSKLSALLPDVKAMVGSATTIPLADASVDVVVCAQAFHWFATAEALTEIHRVLKPGGRFAMIWNMRDSRVGWVAKLDAIVNRLEGDTPRYYSGAWRHVFPFVGFGPLHEKHYSLGHTGSPEQVIVERVRSTSFIGALPAQEQAKVDAQVRALIESEPELKGQASVTVPYETAAFYTVKSVVIEGYSAEWAQLDDK